VFPNDAQLAALGLSITADAAERCAEAEGCFLCKAPPISPRASEARKIQWLRNHGAKRVDVTLLLEAVEIRIKGRSASDTETAEEITSTGKALIAESTIEPTVAVAEEVVEQLVNAVNEVEESVLTSELVFPICRYCANSDSEDTSSVLEERYVDFRFGGNRTVAQAQPIWPSVAELITRIRKINSEEVA
jgi:hypothetical protein